MKNVSISTYVVFIGMVIFSICIVWIYFTVDVVPYEDVPFDKNTALHALNEKNIVKVFYILVNDNGNKGKQIGCGDSVVGVNKEILATTTPLMAALGILLSDKNETATSSYGELRNSLHASNLKFKSIAVKGDVTEVQLSGSFSAGGVCDDPRIIAQLEETAKQFDNMENVKFYVNGKLLEDVLSGK